LTEGVTNPGGGNEMELLSQNLGYAKPGKVGLFIRKLRKKGVRKRRTQGERGLMGPLSVSIKKNARKKIIALPCPKKRGTAKKKKGGKKERKTPVPGK